MTGWHTEINFEFLFKGSPGYIAGDVPTETGFPQYNPLC
jgi:hypothetical protein